MKRGWDLALFVPLAAGLHVVAFHVAGLSVGTDGGLGGAGGESVITLAAAPPEAAALLQTWQTAPEVAQALAPLQTPQLETAPRVPDAAPPVPRDKAPQGAEAPTADALPDIPAAPILSEPVPRPKPAEPAKRAERPQPSAAPKPDPAPQPDRKAVEKQQSAAKPKAAAPALVAKGAGKTAAAAGTGKSAQPSLSQGQRNSLAAQWAGKVRAKIEQRKRYPNAERRAGVAGRAVVVISLSAEGRVLGVKLRQSSGVAGLDRAALAAAQASRFPKAPKGWDGDNYSFAIPVNFKP